LPVSFIPEDRRHDVDWLKLQADHGLPEAMYYLARNYADCGDDDSAFEYFEKAAEMDHIDSIRELGKCYHRGRGCVRNVVQAVQLYKTAAAGKDHLALTLLGQIYERGVGNAIPRDAEAAAHCYTAAMEYGSVNAIYLAAQMHHTRGEHNTAIELYRTAADQGNVMANVMCARYALTGLGDVEKDQEKAFQVRFRSVVSVDSRYRCTFLSSLSLTPSIQLGSTKNCQIRLQRSIQFSCSML
jgi:TPR repeat protein